MGVWARPLKLCMMMPTIKLHFLSGLVTLNYFKGHKRVGGAERELLLWNVITYALLNMVFTWVGDHFVLGFAPTPRFFLSQNYVHPPLSPSDETAS